MAATNEDYVDDTLDVGSYTQLMYSDDHTVVNLDSVECFNFNSHFSLEDPPKMLCFGENREDYGWQLVENSSAADSNAKNNNAKLSKTNKKRNGSPVKESHMKQNSVNGVHDASASKNRKNIKKSKGEHSTIIGHAKVKKEKLGERIKALQQIVSPFGKTDTASVLHEALGYIKFLLDQLQVLSSPYLHRLPTSPRLLEEKDELQMEASKDLRSRGLCLVPIELTSHVTENNGADFWSPTMAKTIPPTSL
ncbi:basic helix-loop-helix transcription factor [Lithospermum erythrorhizon]|uniref:Basic helix-loop-helix transcription factor n=1 Tax=Lithospermum erythrorhizon TaxID=34254 RepID=A0AAV3P4M5_LITER